jgi:hypothetical protein
MWMKMVKAMRRVKVEKVKISNVSVIHEAPYLSFKFNRWEQKKAGKV